MILVSDFLVRGFVSKEDKHNIISQVFSGWLLEGANTPEYEVWIDNRDGVNGSKVQIKKAVLKPNRGVVYKVVFDGVLNGPNDVSTILRLLKIA